MKPRRPAREAAAIVADLRALAGPNALLSMAEARRSSPALVGEARRSFGNWTAALAAAGVRRPLRFPYPREGPHIIADLQAMAGPGGSITLRDAYARQPQLVREARRLFGSWKAALAAAGLPMARSLPPPRSAEAIAGDLRSLARNSQNLHAGSVMKTHRRLVREAVRCFGHWHAALTAAGVPIPRRGPLPREAALIIADLKALAAGGQSMRPSNMEASHAALFREAQARFGKWDAVLAAAGLELTARRVDDRTFTRESLLARLKDLSAKVNPMHQFVVMTMPGCSSVGKWSRYYFGTWNAALEAAGIKPPPPPWREHLPKHSPRLPDAAAVVEAIKARAASGLPLLLSSLHTRKAEGGDFLLSRAATRFFGSWTTAVEAAGLLEAFQPVVSRERLPGAKFSWRPVVSREPLTAGDVLARLRARFAAGRPISGKALHRGPDKDSALYNAGRRHFGSWPAAVTAAGLPVMSLRVLPLRRKAAMEELQRRYRDGEPVAARAVISNGAAGRRLYRDLFHSFGDWKKALIAAGIPPNAPRPLHPRHRFGSKADIVRGLRERLAAGQPIDLATLNRNRAHGGDTTLMQYARRYYRKWADAIRDARAPDGDPAA